MTAHLPASERHRRLQALEAAGDIDVLIIGAGVNGAGLFRVT